MDKKAQSRDLNTKKDNAFHSKPTDAAETKEASIQENQPQWKMSAPSKRSYNTEEEAKLYYSQFGMEGFPTGSESAMGMMTYPFDYMAWNYGMVNYPAMYYKRGSKPFHAKKKKNDFGYESPSKRSKPKVIFVPITSKTEGNNQNSVEDTKNNSTGYSDEASRTSNSSVRASEYKNLENAKFFVIKSYSEEDVYKAIKNNLWCSTPAGNQKLNDAFIAANGEYPILLLFSINGSGHFIGVCQMKSAVDFERNFEGWNQNHKWRGSFEISWIYIKDVPNQELRHLKNEMNEGKPVPNSRDTQEVPNATGLSVLEIFEKYQNQTSILDLVDYYEREVKKEL
eukprot:CAMPEP_0176425438 /NCGR_PEP_ID=MMETSP0127-20121128/11387_1 /TAXON_ID=938130 /ORGANISM="Platyophrya macrostoma, Strain WH" /LENGTH=338 /DNA_ID=CAMNT_0017806595 /DNA_START=1 /DNA_END=1017 /DNA_ORIENTATION=-